MATLVPKTAGECVVVVAELLGDRVEDFTASSGTSTTVVAPASGISATNNDYSNYWAYIYGGTGAGQERNVTSYTGSSRTFTVTAWGSTPDSTSKVLVTRRYRPSIIYQYVSEALRELAQLFPTPLMDGSLRTGNLLVNGHFEEWDSSGSLADQTYLYTRWKANDGWQVSGTSGTTNREATIVRNSSPFTQYSAKLISATNNSCVLSQQVPAWGMWAGVGFNMKAWAYATTPNRVRLYLNDGVNTGASYYSSYHSGTAGWEELSILGVTTATASTQLLAQCRIESGSSATAYFDDVRLTPLSGSTASYSNYYRIPGNFTYLTDVFVEDGGNEGEFPIKLNGWWDVVTHDDGYPYLYVPFGYTPYAYAPYGYGPYAAVPIDVHLKLVGQGYRTDTIAVGTNVELSPQIVVNYSAMLLARAYGTNEDFQRFKEASERMMAQQPRRRATSSARVR